MRLNRRKFLQVSAGVATAMALTSKKVGAQLKPVVKVGNPLDTSGQTLGGSLPRSVQVRAVFHLLLFA